MPRPTAAGTSNATPHDNRARSLITVVGRPGVPRPISEQAPNQALEQRQARVNTRAESVPAPQTSASADPARARAQARECGPCRLCCRLPDIPELAKPINTWCVHIDLSPGAAPCTIYDRRPDVCRGFDCAWKQGLGDEDDRPDILGVMWQTVTLPDGRPGLGVVEARPGALESPRVRRQLERFEARKPGRIIIRRAHETRFAAVGVLVEGKPLERETVAGPRV